ncbi:hypothetical protein [Exiguobacterium sp. s192]|uniref:hypothetical protein n=1 Tax=Exiguobacterium sp. s192 TaxID=2751206 RepID=UPI001BEA5CE1|nr:hypothetical protein [Exiguobacterium sp. s192]
MTVGQSRWMEQPLIDEQKRLAALSEAELNLRLNQLQTMTSEDDILYLLYTIQEAFLAREDGIEAYLAIVDPFLGLDGVEQVLAIFMYEKGERYAFDLALRTASPYLPYGLALKLEEVAASRSRTARNVQQTDDASYLQLEEKPAVTLTEQDWITLYRFGTLEEQVRFLAQTDLRVHPELMHYIVHDYLTGRDVKHPSALVIQRLLPQLTESAHVYPIEVSIQSLDVHMLFHRPEQLESCLTQQAIQLQRLADAAFDLERMDPFKALLLMNWYQIVYLEETMEQGEVVDEWLGAVEELADLDFLSEAPPESLSPQAQKIYRAVHLVLPEGKLYEQALLQ